jgi:hypothetical protein
VWNFVLSCSLLCIHCVSVKFWWFKNYYLSLATDSHNQVYFSLYEEMWLFGLELHKYLFNLSMSTNIRRTGHTPPRVPSVGWWVLTIANAAGTNSLTGLPKHGGAQDSKFLAIQWLTNVRDCMPKHTDRGAIEPFSFCVIHKEGLCPSSGDINRLMMMFINISLRKFEYNTQGVKW